MQGSDQVLRPASTAICPRGQPPLSSPPPPDLPHRGKLLKENAVREFEGQTGVPAQTDRKIAKGGHRAGGPGLALSELL